MGAAAGPVEVRAEGDDNPHTAAPDSEGSWDTVLVHFEKDLNRIQGDNNWKTSLKSNNTQILRASSVLNV